MKGSRRDCVDYDVQKLGFEDAPTKVIQSSARTKKAQGFLMRQAATALLSASLSNPQMAERAVHEEADALGCLALWAMARDA